MLYSLPTLAVATFYGVHKATVHRWAKRENWASIPRKGKGAGEEWLIHSMPKGRQRFLNNAHMREEMARLASKQPAEPVNTVIDESQSLNGIPQHGKRVAEAKMYVVNYSLALQKATGKPLTNVLFEVACQFENRTAPFPEWVYQALRGASRCSIRNWINEEKENGIYGLAKQHAPRVPRNIIDNNPKLKEVALGLLWNFPHISAAQIFRAFEARFGPEGKDYDPSIKLPSERRVQAWLTRWKTGHEQLLLAHVNPDKHRSAHKVAFGDASAHIHYMNQEWQSDGTLCELMLNDGRRHTLNLTIDVYSRRLKFHVSRTSSAAAVASGQRKCILAWGKCDTWKTDNGTDYKNNHLERFCGSMGIDHELCPPFSPEKKPFVERAFKTFLHSHIEIMQGYLGHSVAERKDIEARKSFADRLYKKMKTPGEQISLNISPEELQRVCDQWAEHVYGNEPHSGIEGMTPNQKAAAYNGSIKRVKDERALDVLLLPVPGNNGIRTVRKPGIAITSKQHGLTIKGHYFSADLTPLMGRKVLVRLDDTDLGRVYLFDPVTEEYLGKAEHPGWLGWTPEQVRNAAIAAVRKQKAEIAEGKKEWRKTAKRADVSNIADEIIETAVRRAAKAAPTSAHETIVHTTNQLEQATRTFTGDFTTPTAEEHAHAMANLESMIAPEQPKGFVVPQEIGDKLTLWHSLYDRKAAGEALEDDAQRWFTSFAKNEICKAYCLLHGLDIALATNG